MMFNNSSLLCIYNAIGIKCLALCAGALILFLFQVTEFRVQLQYSSQALIYDAVGAMYSDLWPKYNLRVVLPFISCALSISVQFCPLHLH